MKKEEVIQIINEWYDEEVSIDLKAELKELKERIMKSKWKKKA